MAKKKASSSKESSKSKEDDYEFIMPDFDEEAFRHKEIQGAQASFVTFGLAILVGIIARALQVVAGDWHVGLLAVALGLVGLRYVLPALGFDAAVEQGLRGLIGDLFLMFFTALAIWVLLSNPPFATLF